jgi:hypothetical protein
MATGRTVWATLSMAVCVAVVLLWVRSYRQCDVLAATDHPGDHLTVTSEFGKLVFEIEWPQPANVQRGWSYFGNPLPRRFGQTSHLGFAVYSGAARHYVLLPPTELWGITFPHWFAFFLTSIAPAAWIARRSAIALNRGAGKCTHCGYDLRATPHRCPECGAPVTNGVMAVSSATC